MKTLTLKAASASSRSSAAPASKFRGTNTQAGDLAGDSSLDRAAASA